MTRLSAVFWIGLVLASGFTTFKVKYAVQAIDDELVRVRKQTIAERQEIHVLTAEWSYLNQPERLAELNRVYLQLVPLTAKQLQRRTEDIAWRTPPAGSALLVAAIPRNASGAIAMPPATQVPPAVPAEASGAGAVNPPPPAPLQLAKATPSSLDALIAQIADPQ